MELRPGHLAVARHPALLHERGSDPVGATIVEDTYCFVLDQQTCTEAQLVHTGRFRSIQDLRFKTVAVEKARVILSDSRIGWIRCEHLEIVGPI